MSLRPRQVDGPMAYLNRGQFYALTLSETGFRSSLCQPRGRDWPSGATQAQRPDGKLSSCQQWAGGSADLQQDTVVQVSGQGLYLQRLRCETVNILV